MAVLNPVILGFLRLRSMTGYELKRNIEHSVGQFWTASYGGLYPALGRLAADGQIRLAADAQAKIYDITEEGRDAFSRWLEGRGSRPTIKDEFLLRLFFSSDDELARLRPAIGRRIADNADRAALLDEVAERARSMTRGQALCLELGREQLESEQRLLLALQAEQLLDSRVSPRGADLEREGHER